ncbi:MAG TPA: D-glycerate dehydrogenase [Allosphingosinicella sp.]|jgi:glyoxylate reductase
MKVIVTRRLPAPVEAKLAERFEVELNPGDEPLDRHALQEAMARCEVLAPAVTDRIDAGLIESAGPRLKLIANFGAGTDNIDLAAARARGIAVTNTPGVLTEDTADLVMALILMAMRGLGEGERILRGGRWHGWGPTDRLGRGLAGKALGIVGMGRIGRAVARRAKAFGMEIHYHNRSPAADAQARFWPDLEAMLAAMDVVSLNAPYGPETHHIIDGRRLALMRPSCWLINAARGALVDEAALVDALARGAIAGAGLDVYANEPEVHPGLLALPNVVLLPHLGSATIESRTAMGEKVLANIAAFAEGLDLPDRVA